MICVDGMRLVHVSEFKYLGCAVGKWREEEGLQVLLSLRLMLVVSSLSVLGSCRGDCS